MPELQSLYRYPIKGFSPQLASAAHLFKVVDHLLGDDSDYLFGEWSIVDLDLAILLNRLVINGDNVPDKLIKYATQQWQRPSVQHWVNLQRT